jgi:hypothetical protein
MRSFIDESYPIYLYEYWRGADNYWYTNPATGNPFTWDEIDNLQAGVSLREPESGAESYCTYLRVEVNYQQ